MYPESFARVQRVRWSREEKRLSRLHGSTDVRVWDGEWLRKTRRIAVWAVVSWAQRLMPPHRLHCQSQLVQGVIATANVLHHFSSLSFLYGELQSSRAGRRITKLAFLGISTASVNPRARLKSAVAMRSGTCKIVEGIRVKPVTRVAEGKRVTTVLSKVGRPKLVGDLVVNPESPLLHIHGRNAEERNSG